MWYNFPVMKNKCGNVGQKGKALKRRVRVEIDLGALVRNYRKIVAHVKPMRVLSVLKANAYGLGVGAYAKALAEAGCREFGVAEPFEALELLAVLKSGGFAADVQILSSILPDEIAPMVKAGVILPVTDIETAKLISEAAKRTKKTARVHFKLDTGMGRLGILAKDALETIRVVRKLPNLDCEGIFSHCPMAYDPKDPFTKRQIKLFKSIVASCVNVPSGTHLGDSKKITIFAGRIEVWCNGSTRDFGSLSRGSNPLTSTNPLSIKNLP